MNLTAAIKTRLTLLSFFQFFVWGAWLTTIGTYCTEGKGWDFPQFGAIFSTLALSSILMPSLIGIIAAAFLVQSIAIVPTALLTRDMDFRGLFIINAGSALVGAGVAIALAAKGLGPASLAWGMLATSAFKVAAALAFRPLDARAVEDAADSPIDRDKISHPIPADIHSPSRAVGASKREVR